jgi:lysophospholipase L1-like esterase
LIVLFIGFTGIVCAQQTVDYQKYPFLNQAKNSFEFAGDSAAFMKFYQKLDTLIFSGKEQINIVHFGGSHVQAGTLSGRMRQNFLHLSPDLKHDRGFFFPYKLAGTNNPSDYKVSFDGFWEGCRSALPAASCLWGVSGINASTIDTNAAFSITAFDVDTLKYAFTKVRVFYVMHDSSLVIRPANEYKLLKTRYDSVMCFVEFTFAQPYTTLHMVLNQADSTQKGFTLQGLQYVSDMPGLTYHAIGVNGAATYSYLRGANFSAQLKSLKPDLVIFGIGINDAHRPTYEFSQTVFEQNYDSLIARIRSVNPEAVFIFMTNNDSYYKNNPNHNIYKVQKAMQNLSARYQSPVWDLFEVMGGINSIRTWELNGLAKKDKIHLTAEGYLLNADLLFEAFSKSYGNHLQNQANLSK